MPEPRRSALEWIDGAVLSVARHWLPVTLALISCVLILPIVAPAMRVRNLDFLADILYLMYRPLCHQHPERSLSVMGEPMAFCARDFAMVSGALMGGLLFRAARGLRVSRTIPRWFIVALMLPMIVDGVTQLVGPRESTNELRLLTGGLFGVAVATATLPSIDVGFRSLTHDIEARWLLSKHRSQGVSP